MEAIKNQQTLFELALKCDLSPVVISKWKSEFLENMAIVFEKGTKKKGESGPDVNQLYAQLGQLKLENEFFLKKFQKTGGQ